ncbi:MAG: DUF1350 family protein [Spirulinaceae cyanobacterium]
MDWQEIYGSWVLIPRQPIGIIHFLGGAFVASAPHVTYRWLLEQLGKQGYVIVATPFLNTSLDHGGIARSVLNRFETITQRLENQGILSKGYLPIYGIGHSMGCKLHLLIGSLYAVKRAGNILISYNNYPVRRAIPFMDQFAIPQTFNVEFTPSPDETTAIIAKNYCVRRNLLIKFTQDNIDQTVSLTPVLQNLFPNLVAAQTLPGNHLTPLGQEINWQTGTDFTPLDAIGQWVKQGALRDVKRLNQEVSRWLNPLG